MENLEKKIEKTSGKPEFMLCSMLVSFSLDYPMLLNQKIRSSQIKTSYFFHFVSCMTSSEIFVTELLFIFGSNFNKFIFDGIFIYCNIHNIFDGVCKLFFLSDIQCFYNLPYKYLPRN